MNRLSVVGVGLTGAGVVGYLVGVAVPYPGRAFSLTALMGGLTMLAVARSSPGAVT